MINTNYVVKIKVPCYVSRSENNKLRISHIDIKAQQITLENDIYILDMYLVSSYLGLRCYDIKEQKEYRLYIDLDYDIKEIFDIISEDVEKNKIKIKLMNKDIVLYEQKSPEAICLYRDKLLEQANNFLKTVHCDLYYIGDRVSYKGKEYIVQAILGHYNVTLINKEEKRKCRTGSITLVERASYPSPFHNTRF